MRIFYLITELDVGGAEKTLFELATHLDRARFEPVVGCLSGQGEVGQWLSDKGVEVVHFDMRSRFDWGVVGRVAGELRRRKPDVLHTFLFHANFVGRLAALRAGVERVISSVRVEERRRLHLLGDWLTQGLMEVQTCVSTSTLEYTRRRARIPLRKLVVVPNGIDLARFEDVAPCPADWELPNDGPVVAAVGRLDRQKAPLTLVRAFARVRERHADAVLAYAGDGPMRGQVEREIERLGLRDHVRLLGWVEDVRPLLARADVFALASQWEGMPNCVLEAMACGAPVVCTAVGGCPELVDDGVTGFLVAPGDADALADRVARLLGDGGLRKRMNREAKERLRRRFTIESMVAANEALYECHEPRHSQA